ncbi:MAG TPA: PPE family protein, partial [Mycobacterium sp.]
MDYGLRPPEINSGLIYTGPGSGPLLAAAASWDAAAAQLESTAAGYSSQISGLAGQVWFGPSSIRMAAAATPYIAWLQTVAAQAAQTSAQAYAAAAAYEAAFAATVPPPVIAANRAQLFALIATNFFGQNSPAIAVTEAQYAAYWAQDAAAMYGYAVASSSATSTLTSYNEPPRTTNQAGQADQTRALAQTTANTTSSHTQSLAQLADPTLQPGNTITLEPGGVANLNAGVSVQVPAGFPAGFASANGVTVDVTQGSTTLGSGVITLGPGGYFYTSGVTTFTVQSGTIYTSPGTAASLTVTEAAVDVTGTSFTWNPATGVLIASGPVNVAAAVVPPAPVAPSASAAPGVAALSSSPG